MKKFFIAMLAVALVSAAAVIGCEHNASGGRISVYGKQLFLENGTIPYTGNGTVKVRYHSEGGIDEVDADTDVGRVADGKLTFDISAPAPSRYLVAVGQINGLSVSNPDAKTVNAHLVLFEGNGQTSNLSFAKVEGSDTFYVEYIYFDKPCSMKGIGADGTNYSIDAVAGWNKVYVHWKDGIAARTSDLSNTPADLRWMFWLN
jgi:hypothetical protein